MASPEALAIKEQLRLLGETVGGTESVEEQRAQFEMAVAMMTVAPEGVAWTEVDAGGVPAIWADPEGCSPDHVVMYVHGGGWTVGHRAFHVGQRVLGAADFVAAFGMRQAPCPRSGIHSELLNAQCDALHRANDE